MTRAIVALWSGARLLAASAALGAETKGSSLDGSPKPAQPASSAGSTERDPAAPVWEVYRIERSQLSDHGPVRPARMPPWFEPHRSRLFSKRFAGLWAAADRRFEKTGYRTVDHDPFISGQDVADRNLSDLVIDIVRRSGDRAEVRARFTSFQAEVRFDVYREDDRWVIDDVRVGAGSTARSLAANACADTGQPATADRIDSSWKELYAHFRDAGQCEGGAAIGEAFSESVLGLMTDSWKDLPEFVALAKSDAGFHAFVLRHVDDMHGAESIAKIRTHAKSDCPPGATSMCDEIADQASEVIALFQAIRPR